MAAPKKYMLTFGFPQKPNLTELVSIEVTENISPFKLLSETLEVGGYKKYTAKGVTRDAKGLYYIVPEDGTKIWIKEVA